MAESSGEGEQAVHSQRARCREHGLVVGGDGKCVLCRRPQGAPEGPASLRGSGASIPVSDPDRPERGTRFPIFGLLALATLGGGAYFGYLKMTSPDAPVSRDPLVVAAVAPTEASEGASEEPGTIRERRTAGRRLADPDVRSARDIELSPSSSVEGRGDSGSPEAAQRSLTDAEIAGFISGLDVQLYATSWCGYCKKARDLFAANGVTYREHDVERDPSAQREKDQLSPGTGVPVVKIGDDVITGYNPSAYARAISRGVEKASGVPVRVQFKTLDE